LASPSFSDFGIGIFSNRFNNSRAKVYREPKPKEWSNDEVFTDAQARFAPHLSGKPTNTGM